MARRPEPSHAHRRPAPKRVLTAGRQARRIARQLAQASILAAGIAAAQLSTPEIDPRFPMFHPNLVDRLHAPITRHHE
jgi:hypothetical protein